MPAQFRWRSEPSLQLLWHGGRESLGRSCEARLRQDRMALRTFATAIARTLPRKSLDRKRDWQGMAGFSSAALPPDRGPGGHGPGAFHGLFLARGRQAIATDPNYC